MCCSYCYCYTCWCIHSMNERQCMLLLHFNLFAGACVENSFPNTVKMRVECTHSQIYTHTHSQIRSNNKISEQTVKIFCAMFLKLVFFSVVACFFFNATVYYIGSVCAREHAQRKRHNRCQYHSYSLWIWYQNKIQYVSIETI